MSDATTLLALLSIAALSLAVMVGAALRAWRDWLELKRLELGGPRRAGRGAGRLELADLRERVRRLETIADGSDLQDDGGGASR